MKTKFTVLAFLLTLFAAGTSFAATRYVDDAGSNTYTLDPDGAGPLNIGDPNSCLISGDPCATITYAHSVADPGDTIEVDDGTYTEGTILITKSFISLVGPNAGTTGMSARVTEAEFTGATHEYIFDLDTTGVDLSENLRFAVAASDGLNIRRSVNTASVWLEGTANESWNDLPHTLRLDGLWPVPARQQLHARVSGVRPSNLFWQLVDVSGRVVSSGEGHHPGGESVLDLDVSGLAAGWYAIRLRTDSDIIQKSVLIAR